MLKPIVFVLALLLASPAFSQTPDARLSKCLEDNTTGRDRKDLARWFFSAMTVHPDLQDLANPSTEITEQTSRTMGRLVTRLYTVSCVKPAQDVARSEGQKGLAKSFETLGGLAMMEIGSNPEVTAALSRYERYVDQEKMESTFNPKQALTNKNK